MKESELPLSPYIQKSFNMPPYLTKVCQRLLALPRQVLISKLLTASHTFDGPLEEFFHVSTALEGI